MQELLRIRLAGLPGLALAATVGLPLLAYVLHALQERGTLKRPATASARSLVTDLAYLLASPITETFSRVVITCLLAGCAVLAGRELSPALLDGFGPAARQPRGLMVLEMLVLGDFFYYWAHRFAHTVPLFWRFHAVHHSAPQLRWTSATRTHPADVWVLLVHILPLALLGFPVDALAFLAPGVTLYAMWIHSGSNVSLRWVSYAFNSPRFHRWHHALDVRDGTVNYAGLFPFYDALFGSYHLPEHAPPAVGIDDPHMPEGYFAQLGYPFRGALPRLRGELESSLRHAFLGAQNPSDRRADLLVDRVFSDAISIGEPVHEQLERSGSAR